MECQGIVQCNGTSFLLDWESSIGDVTRCMVRWLKPFLGTGSEVPVIWKKETTFRELERGRKSIKADKIKLINWISYATTFVLMWILTALIVPSHSQNYKTVSKDGSCHSMYCIVSLRHFQSNFNGSLTKIDVWNTLLLQQTYYKQFPDKLRKVKVKFTGHTVPEGK